MLMIEIDEDDDIILPDTIWGELVYIYYILKDIRKSKENRQDKLAKLKRQIKFFICWLKVK